jgi:hypothetical protein
VSSLERWLDLHTRGDGGDIVPNPSENQGTQRRQGVSPPPATAATAVTAPRPTPWAAVPDTPIGSGEVSPVSPPPATPRGDAQTQAGRRFQPPVAGVANVTSVARVAWQGWDENSAKSVKDYLVDLAVWRAHRHEVPGPCPACGDTVFHRAGRGAPWRCRTCEPAVGSAQWIAIGQGPIGRALAKKPLR